MRACVWVRVRTRLTLETLAAAGKRPSSAHAAVWVPDTESKLCMHCKRVQFTVINRRHHCRNCGHVICGNCSKNKFLIPAQSSKPVRVCDACFTELCQRRVSGSASEQAYDVPKPVDGNGKHLEPAPIPAPDAGAGADAEDGAAGAETSDSDEDSADPLESATADLSVEDQKPIFYAEMQEQAASQEAGSEEAAAVASSPNGN